MESDNKSVESTFQLDHEPVAAKWRRAALKAKAISAFRETVENDIDDEAADPKLNIKYGTTGEAALGIFKEYCEYSTIHGIRYLGEKKRPWLERVFWITVFGLSIYVSAGLIINIYYKWTFNPVIVSFAEKSTPVWEIPFPTVTVCAETKGRQTVFNFTEAYWLLQDKSLEEEKNETIRDLTPEEKFRLNAVSQVCDPHLLADVNFANKTDVGYNLIEALTDVMPTFNGTYETCKWRNKEDACKNLFHKFVTEEGVCYSFNSLSPKEIYRDEALISDIKFEDANRTATEWNVEEGYGTNARTDTFPLRVLGPGARAGLYLVLRGLEKDFDNMCKGPVQGFKVLLHTPGEVAQVAKQYFRIPFDQEVLISIKPQIITTSEGLKRYRPHRRQCYFQHERYLRFFQIYTQSNCELECLSNFTYHQCSCVKFSMPRNATMNVCGAASIKCYNGAEEQLLLKEFDQGLESSDEHDRGLTDCDCLPACTSIAYEAEISQADFNDSLLINSMRRNRDEIEEGSTSSRVSIFFKEAQFLTSRRSELYGLTDFLANCGGLLGLFMGVSMLSLVEILYFCTVRLVTNLRMRYRKRKHAAAGGIETPRNHKN